MNRELINFTLAPFSHSSRDILIFKEELTPEVSRPTITGQDLKQWGNVLQFLLENEEQDNPYTYCLLSCLHYMKVKRWQGLNLLQKLIVLSSLNSVMKNDIKLKQRIEQQIDLDLFFQAYQNLLQEVQQNYR